MKSLRYELLILAAAALAIPLWAQQQLGTSDERQHQGMQGMQAQMQGGRMQHGNMDQMMQKCHKDMENMQQSNAQARRPIEAAKQSNDPAKMRAALDEAEKALTTMNDHMAMCGNMMGMIQKHKQERESTTPPQQ